MKSYTDISQSKKLAEILPLESADMYYSDVPVREWIDKTDISKGTHVVFKSQIFAIENLHNHEIGEGDICAWSLAALMNLLPSEFTEKGKYSETTYKIDIRKYALTEGVDLYQIAYGNYKFHEDGNSSWKDMINTGEKEDLIDAVFQMICWLKENNKL